jgi:hypothetical protein
MAQAETLTGPSGSLTSAARSASSGDYAAASATTGASSAATASMSISEAAASASDETADLFNRLEVPGLAGRTYQARDAADAGMTRLEVMAQEADAEAERLTTAAGNTSSAKRGRDYAARALEFTERARLLRAAARQTGALEWMAMERPDKAEAGFVRWQASSFGEWARVRMPPWCDMIVVLRDHCRAGPSMLCDGVVMLPHQLYRATAKDLLMGYPEGTRLVVAPYRSAHRVWLPRDDSSAG